MSDTDRFWQLINAAKNYKQDSTEQQSGVVNSVITQMQR